MAAAKDCTADFVVEDDEPATADVRIGNPGAKGNLQHLSGPSSAQTKRPPRFKAAREENDEHLDAHKVAQRQKQVDKGKNTLGYQRYLKQVPKKQRTNSHPQTPDVHLKGSKRKFDGIVSAWRRRLHEYDEEPQQGGVKSGSGRTAGSGSDANMEECLVMVRPSGTATEDMMALDDESRGSLDAYLGPKSKSKRGREADVGDAAGSKDRDPGLPQPKRSATSRSMDTSQLALASTCSNPGAGTLNGAPTSFAGLGLAARAAAVQANAASAPAVPTNAAAAGPAPAPRKPRIDPADNVVALILGPEAGSCMSWASDS